MRKVLNISLSLLLASSSLIVATNANAARVEDESSARPAVLEHTKVGLPNFDARRDPESLVLNGFNVLSANKMAPVDRTAAIAELKASIPVANPDSVWIDRHDTGIPKTVANHEGFLTAAAVGTPESIARTYLGHNRKAFGLTARDVRNLKLTVNDPDANFGITYLKFAQTFNGVPVFDSEIGVTVTARGEIAIVNTAQHIEGLRISTDAALSAEDGIARAFSYCGSSIDPASLQLSASKLGETGPFTFYESPLGAGHEDIMFQKTIVNVGGVAHLAYRAYVDLNGREWYDTLVDANTGELLYRFNIVSDVQGQVFTSSPGTSAGGSRTLQQFAPQFGVTDPWVGSGTVSTGNNCDAYLDRDANNSADTTTTAATGTNPGLTSGRADTSKGTPSGEFTFSYSSSTAPTSQQANAVTNLWWFNNYMHDWMYSLGFTESARNFQTNNFGRGGAQNDAVKAEAQDGSGTNNANFATPADGSAGRMQQYIFTTTTPNRDSDLDGDVVLHEYGHGVSNRLIGNGSGLGGTQSGAMGEGWSDYWACSNYNDGIMGEYVVNSNAGIRRAVYTVPAATVHDSYADVGNSGFEVHDDGEVWTAALWDLNRTIGKTKADLLVLNGMKNTASSPSFVTARSGIITACNTLYPADVCTVWTVFARHGLGNSASGNDGTSHVAATDLPSSCGGGCSYSISPTSANPGASATTGTVSVTAGSGCSWTATSNASWLTITSGASGSGNGTVGYSVAANSGAARTGTLTIAGQTFTVNQSAGSCSSSTTPITSGSSLGGSLATTDCASTVRTSGTFYYDNFTFSATAGTAYTITLNAPFDAYLYLLNGSTVLTQDDDSNGGTNSKIVYTPTSSGTLTIHCTSYSAAAVGTYTVSLSGGSTCTYSISPSSASPGTAASTGTVSVTAGTGCAWTATSNASWLTITSGASGSGNGSVGYSVAANTGAARTGTMTIAGQTFTVNQAGTSSTVLSEGAESGASGWTVTTNVSGNNWVISTAGRYTGTNGFRSNQASTAYPNNLDQSLISPAFSLAGKTSATLTFRAKQQTETNYDYFRVEISTNGGSTWTNLSSVSTTSSGFSTTAGLGMVARTVSLNSYVGQANVKIRFRLTSDGSVTYWGIALDDILVTAN